MISKIKICFLTGDQGLPTRLRAEALRYAGTSLDLDVVLKTLRVCLQALITYEAEFFVIW